MPFRIEWTATVRGERVVPYTCKACGFESAAVVSVKAEARAGALLGVFSKAAKEEALADADRAAWEAARRMGPLAPCPQCSKRDEAGRAALRAHVGNRFWLMGLLGAALLALLTSARNFPPILIPIGAALAGFFAWREARWMTDELDQRVKVLPAAEGQRRLKKEAPPAPTSPVLLGGPEEWVLPAGVLLAVGLLGWKFVGQRPFGAENDTSAQWVQFGIAAAALGIIGWGLWLTRVGRPLERQRLRDRTLVALGLAGFFAYFNFGHLHFGNFVHVWDTYHYVMGAKYFPELGYEKLYDCAAVANVENGRRDEVARQTITDLRTNVIVKTDELLAHPERCKESFTAERWAAFRADIKTFRSFVGEGRWREIHHDHGYNATPVWTLAGYALTNLGPVSMKQLTYLNLLDPLYLALTLAMIWWAFGPRAFAIAAIVLGTHFPNRFYWTGGAFLRHDWLFFFVASICLLKKDRPGLAGAAFAYTTLLRLFPGLAAVGPALAAAAYFQQHKKLDPRFVRYVVSGVVAAALLVGGSFVAFGGPTTWLKFRDNTVKHANTPLTNHMGLRTVLSWRPDTIGQKTVMQGQIDNWARWKSTRLEKWNEAKPLLFLVFAAGMALVFLALKHSGADPWLGASLGVGFIVLGAELTNYYYCFLLGIAVLHEKKREVGALLCLLSMTSLYLNWGPLPWMSRWLDEQYVTMSLAAIFAVGGIWWLFTRWADGAAAPPEPKPLLLREPLGAATAKR
jgi:hypothetical protein